MVNSSYMPLSRFSAFLILAVFIESSAWADSTCDIPYFKVSNYTSVKAALPDDADDVVLDWPITSTPELNSPFGPRQLGSSSARYDWHRGLDLRLPMGTPLYAPANAVVVHAGSHPGYSDTIVQLRHNDVEPYVYTLYLHLQDVQVMAGEMVSQGDLIAHSGQGSASYPHLHWEVRLDCLFQVCCENPYSWLGYTNNPPAAPELEAFGYDNTLGNMVLLSATVPETEIDFQKIELEWGGSTITAELNELNHLTPSSGASKLDDPLYFYEEENIPFVMLPKRYNLNLADSADYDVLFFNLDIGTTTGMATVGDGAEAEMQTSINPNLPPLTVQSLASSFAIQPGNSVSPRFLVTNNDTTSHQVNMTGISTQSIDLTVVPETATLDPGETIQVEVSGTLDNWPEGVGDAIVLRVETVGGSFTDLLGVSLIDTDENATMIEGWKLY